MRQCKFIFVENKGKTLDFRCGNVIMHEDMLNPKERGCVVVNGGGLFEIKPDTKEIFFWGKSFDFGYVPEIEKTCKKYYNQIMQELADFWYFNHEEELNMDEFSLYYRNELGEKHLIKK